MKYNSKNLLFFSFAVCLSPYLISCQKDKDINQNHVNSSVKNSLNLPVDSSLVAWYTFTDSSLKDKSDYPNSIDAAFSVTPVAGRQGKPNSAYYFNGTPSSYMQVKNSSSLGGKTGITLAALVKPMGFYQGKCHSNRILSKGKTDQTGGRYALGFDDQPFYNYAGCDKPVMETRENFYASYGNSSIGFGGGATDTDYIKVNRWYNIVYTFDGRKSKLYINGVLKMARPSTSSFNYPTTDKLYIGRHENIDFPYSFNGIIDEIRIYNRALSSEEVIGVTNKMGEE